LRAISKKPIEMELCSVPTYTVGCVLFCQNKPIGKEPCVLNDLINFLGQ